MKPKKRPEVLTCKKCGQPILNATARWPRKNELCPACENDVVDRVIQAIKDLDKEEGNGKF